MNRKELQRLNPRDFDNKILSSEDILLWFDALDAVWLHDGDPKKPHAELTSGKCSNGFFDCLRVLENPNLCEILARQLVRVLRENGVCRDPDWVIGSPYAAITFSHEVAKAFRAIHGFCEKDPTDPKGKRMLWRRRTIPAGSKVLQIEELVTTSGTMTEVRRAVEDGNKENVIFSPSIGALVHRPPKLPADYGDRKVIALIVREIWAVDLSECSLCKEDSLRYRPKTHWRELTGKG